MGLRKPSGHRIGEGYSKYSRQPRVRTVHAGAPAGLPAASCWWTRLLAAARVRTASRRIPAGLAAVVRLARHLLSGSSDGAGPPRHALVVDARHPASAIGTRRRGQ